MAALGGWFDGLSEEDSTPKVGARLGSNAALNLGV